MITYENYITANGTYPERLKDPELTDEIKRNSEKLLEKINQFLKELGVENAHVSSGWRPSSVNSKIPNAAKKSLHMSGLAIDIKDVDGKLDKLIESKDYLLKKYGAWQESPNATKGWAHLDIKDRGKRSKNQFIP